MNEEKAESFEGSYQTPQTPKQIVSAYAEKTNPELKKYNKKIVDKSYYELMKYGLIILAVGVLIFGYMAWNDKLKTEISCPSCPAQAEIPPCPSCPENIPCPSYPNITNDCNLNCGDVIVSNLTG